MQTLMRNEPFLVTSWNFLRAGELIEMHAAGRGAVTGWVDCVSADGVFLWIQLTMGRGRVMIYAGDPVEIWRVDARILYEQASPPPARNRS